MSQAPQVQQQTTGLAMPLTPAAVQLTERAAEMVKQAMAQENLENYGLRVGIMGGGCSGLQYVLDFDKEPGTEDFVDHQLGIPIFVDPYSAAHLRVTVVDYVDGLQGAGFKFENPNVSRSCGCGSSFQT